MCNNDCINWVDRVVLPIEVAGKSVLESGARDVNGSVRPIFERLGCADMELIFSDMENVLVQADPYEPGVFVKATKPLKRFREKDLSAYELYSINTLTRITDV